MIVKAFPKVVRLLTRCRMVVIGHEHFLREACNAGGVRLEIRTVADVGQCQFEDTCLEVVSPVEFDVPSVVLGQVGKVAGDTSVQWVLHATDLAVAGRVDAIVTAPLNKEAFNSAGHKYAGHTEMLQERSGAKSSRLMLDIPAKLTAQKIIETVHMTHDFLKQAGIGGDSPPGGVRTQPARGRWGPLWR